ncbi:MAG: undecaprenyl-phosphate glucose phosphotransferase [Planctomycetes bacterium]|nr:undecaprenyl-phosphate glucose phosphotransferase [Planctomycetota bacterium]
MLGKKVQFWRSLLFLLDCALLSWCWILAYQLRFADAFLPEGYTVPSRHDYLTALWLVPPVWLTIFSTLRLAGTRRRGTRRAEVVELLRAAGLFTLVLVSGSWMVFKLSFSRLFLALFWWLAASGLLGLRIAFRELIRQLRRAGFTARNALIVGTDGLARQVRTRLELHPELGLRLVGFLTPHAQEVGCELDEAPVLGDLEAVAAIVRQREVDEVFVAQSAELEPELEALLTRLGDELVDVNLVSDLCKHAMLGGRVENFEGMPVLAVSSSPMIGWGYVVKRCFDVALAALGLALTAPVLLAAALAVRLTSRGPALYAQERFGLDGRCFTIHKLRTMVVDAEKDGPVWGIPNDPRVTTVGRFLRRTSIDELPQLWNVLKGDMSLVGPRPAQPYFVERFKERIPRYMQRHRVKPGLTGWAQIHGQRGDGPADERLKYDLFYIRNWSLGLDVKILWATVCGGFLNPDA